MQRRIGWMTAVRCWLCGYPMHFEAGFWHLRTAHQDGKGRRRAAMWTVICTRCHCKKMRGKDTDGRIHSQRHSDAMAAD